MFDELPQDIQDFIRKNIHSVGHLEVLMLMKRNLEKKWAAEELSKEMRSNTSYAQSQMQDLFKLNLLVCETRDHEKYYQIVADTVLLDLLNKLENIYNSRRTTVISFIYSHPMGHILNFAKAFKLKEDL